MGMPKAIVIRTTITFTNGWFDLNIFNTNILIYYGDFY